MGIFYNPPQPQVGSHTAAIPGWSVDNPPPASGARDIDYLMNILSIWTESIKKEMDYNFQKHPGTAVLGIFGIFKPIFRPRRR